MSQAPRMIERHAVFGVCEGVKDGIQYLDDTMIVWVAGKSLVVLDTQLGTQQLVQCTPTCEAVTAMALSYNRRVLAVAESGKHVAIVIYTFDKSASPALKRKKVLQLPDLGSTEYVSLCFSLDGKRLVALGGFPEWRLLYWNVEKGRLTASCPAIEQVQMVSDRAHLKQCTISPYDASMVCVTGNGVVRFYRLNDNDLHPVPGGLTDEGVCYLSHAWSLSEANVLIVSTNNGDLLLFDNAEFKFLLPLSPSDGLSINVVVAYSKGIVCGGEMGLITVFERTENKEMYRKVRTFRFNVDAEDGGSALQPPHQLGRDLPTILAFALTPPPAEEHLAFLSSTKQIYALNLPNADFTKAEDLIFLPVGQPFHSGPVTGVDTCSQRPLIVTAGLDRCIFLWNSITNAVELRKKFQSEILSVAIHPSGLHLLVGFADGLRLMNVCGSDIREVKHLGIRACAACCFSHGGQFFAATHSTTIHVYYTYTCELLGHLRGHNGKVKSLYFVPPDDTRLITTGADGAVFEFSLSHFHKAADYVTKAVTYNCGVADVATVWASGGDRKLSQFERSRLEPAIEYDLHTTCVTSMEISQKMKLLIGGCDDGTVRVFNTYLGEKLNHSKVLEKRQAAEITVEVHSSHTGTVSKLALTHDESVLVSVGEDGAVVLWHVVAPHRSIGKDVEYFNEVLMDRRDLESTTNLLKSLNQQVTELKERIMQQQASRERAHETQLAKLEHEYYAERARKQQEVYSLEAEKNEQAIRFTEYIAELDTEAHRTIEQSNEDYDAKMESLHARADQLRQLIDDQRREYDRKKAELRKEAMERETAAKSSQAAAMQRVEAQYSALLAKKEQTSAEAAEMRQLIEEDNDTEVIWQKEDYEKRNREQAEELALLQAANTTLLSKENLYKADLEAKTADVTEKIRQQTVLEGRVEAARRDIEAVTNELRERGEAVVEKDRQIEELQRKKQELEKFKFVLEYKIKELRAQIDPREEEIREAKEKLTQMNAETERYQRSNESLVLQIRNLRQKRTGLQRELDGLAATVSSNEEFQSRLWTELSDVYEARDDPRGLKRMAKALYDKYTSSTGVRSIPITLASRTAADEMREYHRERDHLERNLAGLKARIFKDVENGRSDSNRIVIENEILVREVNELRKEAASLAMKSATEGGHDPSRSSVYETEDRREIASQQSEISRLAALAKHLEEQLHAKGIPLPITTDCS